MATSKSPSDPKVDAFLSRPFNKFCEALSSGKPKLTKEFLLKALKAEQSGKGRISHITRLEQRIRKLSSRDIL